MTTAARDCLVGRRRELAVARACLEAARAGRGRLLLVAGEAGIGKSRLLQEVAGAAQGLGATVAWGRCAEGDGAPAYWPWRQLLRGLGLDPEVLLGGRLESPEERFRAVDAVAEALLAAAQQRAGLVLLLDDLQGADDGSVRMLRHVTDRIAAAPVLLVAAIRSGDPAPALRLLLPELLGAPVVERVELQAFDLEEVREQLALVVGDDTAARRVLEATGGNPLFVREVGRAMAEGSWREDRAPRSVLDLVTARLEGVSPLCRRLLQIAALAGRDVSVSLVATALGLPTQDLLPALDEGVANGFVDGSGADLRFVHALTRDAVAGSLTSVQRLELRRALADALVARNADDLAPHLPELARHWVELAVLDPRTALGWITRAADDAVSRVAHEDAVRLYRAALALDVPLSPAERSRLEVALGRAAYFAGDLTTWVAAAHAAAATARTADEGGLLADAALVLEASADTALNALAQELCDAALAVVREDVVRVRLLALRSHLAFYDGDVAATEALSAEALELARASGDDLALIAALPARQEALPGPSGRAERFELAQQALVVGARAGSPRTEMWGRLWRIDGLIEEGRIAEANEELPGLRRAVQRVGGPVAAWHLDRTTACVAQAQSRYAEARETAKLGFERMRVIEPAPASGAWLAMQCALAHHLGADEQAVAMAASSFTPPARFVAMGRLSRAYLLLQGDRPDEAAASYAQAGRVGDWSLPVFFVVPGLVMGLLVALGLGRQDDVGRLLELLEPYSDAHAVGNGVSYLGPVALTVGRGHAALGRLDAAVVCLRQAVERADRAGAPGFVAEARFHLAEVLLTRDGATAEAHTEAKAAAGLVRTLGMTAYETRVATLLGRFEGSSGPLSKREDEVAALVAEGLSNRQIAERLFLSERTAQNHVQHILTKLGFSTRSQIAAWAVRRPE